MDNNPYNRIQTGHHYQYEQIRFLILSHLFFFWRWCFTKKIVGVHTVCSPMFSSNQMKSFNLLLTLQRASAHCALGSTIADR